MTTEEIVEAIRNASNGTFIGEYCSSTLMGWTNEYDELGRLVTCDPNYKDSIFTICGRDYHVTRKEWRVIIWKGNENYLHMMNRDKPVNKILADIDLTPGYVKEYRNRKFEERLSKCYVWTMTLGEIKEYTKDHKIKLYLNTSEMGDLNKYKFWVEIKNYPDKSCAVVKYEKL